MSGFKRVLSDVDFMEILSKTNGFSPTSDGEVYVGSGDDVWFALADFAEKVEQATIAALKEQQEEQEPVIYLYEGDLYADDEMAINDHIREQGTPLYAHPIPTSEQEPVATLKVDSVSGIDVTYHRFQGLYDGMKLYTHPAPALEPDYFFYKGKLHCNDGGTHLNHGAKEHGRPLYDLHMPETKEHHRTAKNHIPDTDKMVCENCQYLPDGSSLVDEVKVMVEMLEDKEWAEYIGKTELGIRLERAVSALHNELLEVQGRHIFIDGGGVPDGWQLVPKEPTENQIVSAMDASVLGRPSVDDETYVMSIIDAYLKAAPRHEEVKK